MSDQATRQKSPKEFDLLSYLPYPLVENEDGFLFTTDAGVEYLIATRSDAHYFPELEFSDLVFSFSVYPKNNGEASNKDLRIEATVTDSLQRIYEANPNVIISFICSKTDNLQRHRFILFGRWYQRNGNGFTRLLYTNADTGLYTALVFREGNPYCDQIKAEFLRLYIDK